jgi:NADPH-dependent curcumin reductase
MSNDQNQRIVLASSPDGELRPSNFRLETAPTPVPVDGQLLLETIFLSIDPYMRFWMRPEKSYNEPIRPGDLIVGATVSRVRRSRHPDWREGEWVLAFSGWQRFAISDGTGLRRIDPAIAPPSTAATSVGPSRERRWSWLRPAARSDQLLARLPGSGEPARSELLQARRNSPM